MRYAPSLPRIALAACVFLAGGVGANAVAQSAPRALVYCPIGIDTSGCDNIVAALGAAGTGFGGIDRGWDGTSGTVDLGSADLTQYAVVIVPSLADGADGRPYDRLRSAVVAGRLKTVITGRQAIWSGTPDLGTAGAAEKTTLVQSLAAWAAGGSGTGLVGLLDGSDSTAQRYDWVARISALAVVADSTPGSYAAVLPLTATGTAIVTPGGQALAYTNMAAFGLHAGSGTSQDVVDSASAMPVLVTTSGAGPAPAPTGLRALVYCPVADAGGCDNIVAALTAGGTPFTGGTDRGYDGSTGTVDLRTADLSGYGVFVVPSLADGADGQPYAVLRDPAVAGRLKPLLGGPVAVWSGTPDLGDSSRTQKNILITNLAKWAAAAAQATAGARGLVALQDASDSVPARYSWLGLISRVSLAADTTLNVYSNVQALTQTAVTLLNDGTGLQLGYTNMASFGLLPGSGLGADAAGGRTASIVLATSGSAGGTVAGLATVTTDREDYQPGDTVTVTGAGWAPGETVSLLFHEEVSPPIHPDITLTAVADANGHILNHQYPIDTADLNVRFDLTATGQTSGRTAQATFTDNKNVTVAKTGTGTGTVTNSQPLPANQINCGATCSAAFGNTDQVTLNAVADAGSTIGSWTVPAYTINSGCTSGASSCQFTMNNTAQTISISFNGAATTTAVTSSQSPSVFGQSVTLTAAVTKTSGGGAVTVGTVTFIEGGTCASPTTTLQAAQTVNGSGQVTFTSSSLSVATHTITACYGGGSGFAASSANQTQTVNRAATTTSITLHTPNPSTAGQAVTVNYTIAVGPPGAGTPTGNVTVTDGTDSCTGTVAAGTCSITLNTTGARTLTATYAGDGNFTGSTSAGVAHQVNQTTSTTTLASSANPSVFGQPVTLTATVKNGATPITVGNIRFIEGGTCVSPGSTLQAAQPVNGSGVVTYATAGFAVAAHTIIACYDGTGSFAPSQATLTQTVNRAATTTTISSDTPDPSAVGQAVTVNFAVAVTAPGAGTPTGNVTVTDGTDSCTGTVAAGTCSITLNTAGARTLTATYAGDGNFTTSTSAGAAHQVNQIGTTTAVASSLNPSTFGQSVTFTATVTSGVNPVTVGSVTFIEGGTCAAPTTTLQAAQAVSGSGQATFATSVLAVASHTILACYGGSGSFAASSGNVVQTVNVAPTTLTPATASGTFGGTATLSATLIRTSGGPVAGETITFTVNGSSAGSATTNASGVATIAAASLGGINAGSYPTGVSATFAGDATYATSTGTASLTVSPTTLTVTLTVSPTSVVYGSTVNLTADLSQNLSGRTISFSIDGTPVGTGATNGSGKAQLMAVNPASFGLNVGSHTVTATFPAEQNYATASGTGSLTITQGTTTTAVTSSLNPSTFGQSVTFTATVSSAGGTPTGSATFIEGGTCASPTTTLQAATPLDGTGKATLTTTTLTAGSHTVVACFLGSTNFGATNGSVAQTVNKSTPTVTWATPADIPYGTALSATQLNATASVPGSFVYTPAATTVLSAGTAQTLSVSFTPTDAVNYASVPATTVHINVLQATPTVTWATPADIPYGTALSATQLNATASVPGSFVYTPAATTVLGAGAAQTLSVSFTPTDAVNYASVPATTVHINVLKGTPTVTWATPADIPYGTALSATQLNATASVPGSFVYSPAATTVLGAGAGQTLSVSFTPTDATNYASVPATTVHINVLKATPTVTWATPADIPYGTALNATQLNATASVPGSFVYTPAATTVLGAGTAQTLSVSFTPTDATNYASVPATTVHINVLKGTPTVTWATPADIPYGTALSATQLNATASVPGSFVYTPAATTVLGAGTGQTLSVSFTPTDAVNYASVPATTVHINVLQATPTVTWATPADIPYGTALSATQLNATASVPGSFVYTPAATTVLGAGAAQTLSVSFTPTDATNYASVPATTVHINVLKGTPTVTWATPADIPYGTALSATQLNATASVPGSFVYTPAATTVLGAGAGQTLSVSFTPTDATNYNSVPTTTVHINVLKGTPTVTWATPADIPYGTALSATQLNATASVPGSFVYSPAATTLLSAGTAQTLSVSFTPTDATNYASVPATTVHINVLQATPTVTWATPADIPYGTALSATQLNATASVPGSFVYTPAATTVLSAGTAQTLSVSFTPTDATNYASVPATTVHINVLKGTPTVTWATPADIPYGTALSATQLNATASVPGSFVYTPAATTVLGAGAGQTLSVSFTPTDAVNYASVPATTVHINVLQATPTVTWATPADIPYGTALSATQLNATASVPGSFVYSPAATTVLGAGTGQTLSVSFTPTDATNYNSVPTTTVHINVLQATPTVSVAGGSFPYDAAAHGATGFAYGVGGVSNVLTPAVTFSYLGISGTTYPASATAPTNAGTYQVTASFAGNTNYAAAANTATVTITRATPTVTWATPADITYGTALSATQLNATASVPGSFVYTPAATTVLGAGTGQTLSVSFAPTDATNYTSVPATTVHINVLQAALTITANSIAKAYGSTYTFAGTEFGASGLVNGDAVTAVTLASSGTGSAAAVGAYPIFVSAATGTGGLANYTITYTNGTLTVAPPTQSFSIGPSSMEGAILISNGDWLNGGYSFQFKDNKHIATNFFVNATVTLTGPCVGGAPGETGTVTFPVNGTTNVAAGYTDWLPTGDANSVLSWEGSVKAANVCNTPGAKLDASKGAVFKATVSQSASTGSLVAFRFKYRDPAAKGKPNTNCLNTSDPNRALADVCGASWSQTVTTVTAPFTTLTSAGP